MPKLAAASSAFCEALAMMETMKNERTMYFQGLALGLQVGSEMGVLLTSEKRLEEDLRSIFAMSPEELRHRLLAECEVSSDVTGPRALINVMGGRLVMQDTLRKLNEQQEGPGK